MIGFGQAAWPLIILAAVAGALTWFTYNNSSPSPKGLYAWLLPALRFVALFVLLALLFEPILRRSLTQTDEPVLAILIDESQSMQQHSQALDWPTIEASLQFFGFGGEIRPLDNLEAARDTAPRTNIGDALRQLREQWPESNPGSAVLVSDGQFNTGPNPLYVAEDYGFAIHTVAVGDSTEQRDVRIVQALTSAIAYAGQEVSVELVLFSRGYETATVAVELYEADSLLSTSPHRLTRGESRLTLTYIPQTHGLRSFTAVVTPLEGEMSTRNNRTEFTMRVLERSQQVVIVAAAPHPDLASVRSILARGEGRNVLTFVQKSPDVFYEGPFTIAPDSCDLLVLIGFPGPDAQPQGLQVIQDLLRRDTAVLFMLNAHTDLGQLGLALGPFLPVSPDRTLMPFDEAIFSPTLIGNRHPVLNFDHQGFASMPPLMFGTGRWILTPDAQVLGQAIVRDVALGEPLLVIRNTEGHRSATLLGSGVWRWQNLSGDPDEASMLWPQMLENLVAWLTAPEDNQRVRVTPTSSVFEGYEQVRFTGQVFDESLQPVQDAEVTLDLIAEDNRQYPYILQSTGDGRYTLDLEQLPEGVYEYRARAVRMGQDLGSDGGAFSVRALGLEYRDTRADTDLLRQIALRSGGQFITPATLHELPEALAADSSFRAKHRIETLERVLWQWPMMVLLIIGLLSTEWILRKRSGLV